SYLKHLGIDWNRRESDSVTKEALEALKSRNPGLDVTGDSEVLEGLAAAFNLEQFAKLSDFHLPYLAPTQIPYVPVEKVKLLRDPAQLMCWGFDGAMEITRRYMLTEEQVKGLCEEQRELLPAVDPRHYHLFDQPWQIAALQPSDLDKIDLKHAHMITEEQLRAIDPKLLTGEFLKALSADQVRVIPVAYLEAIAPHIGDKVTSAHIETITSPALVGRLEEIAATCRGTPIERGLWTSWLPLKMVKHICRDQAPLLTREQIPFCPVEYLDALSDTQLASVNALAEKEAILTRRAEFWESPCWADAYCALKEQEFSPESDFFKTVSAFSCDLADLTEEQRRQIREKFAICWGAFSHSLATAAVSIRSNYRLLTSVWARSDLGPVPAERSVAQSREATERLKSTFLGEKRFKLSHLASRTLTSALPQLEQIDLNREIEERWTSEQRGGMLVGGGVFGGLMLAAEVAFPPALLIGGLAAGMIYGCSSVDNVQMRRQMGESPITLSNCIKDLTRRSGFKQLVTSEMPAAACINPLESVTVKIGCLLDNNQQVSWSSSGAMKMFLTPTSVKAADHKLAHLGDWREITHLIAGTLTVNRQSNRIAFTLLPENQSYLRERDIRKIPLMERAPHADTNFRALVTDYEGVFKATCERGDYVIPRSLSFLHASAVIHPRQGNGLSLLLPPCVLGSCDALFVQQLPPECIAYLPRVERSTSFNGEGNRSLEVLYTHGEQVLMGVPLIKVDAMTIESFCEVRWANNQLTKGAPVISELLFRLLYTRKAPGHETGVIRREIVASKEVEMDMTGYEWLEQNPGMMWDLDCMTNWGGEHVGRKCEVNINQGALEAFIAVSNSDGVRWRRDRQNYLDAREELINCSLDWTSLSRDAFERELVQLGFVVPNAPTDLHPNGELGGSSELMKIFGEHSSLFYTRLRPYLLRLGQS
ncbi:MAG: hypothetical protein KDK40_03315, partial [Chlamydiia bacterium]|nr:hypothetical protein [Chlamydiia bacterium]